MTVMLGPPVQGAPPGLKSSRSAVSRNVDHPPTTALGVFSVIKTHEHRRPELTSALAV